MFNTDRSELRALSLERLYRSRIRLQHLRLLIAIDEEHNLRRAAELLHMSEPAASKCLKVVEGLFGVPLFHRDTAGMAPTVYLAPIVRIARSIIGGIEEVGEEIESLRNGVSGRVAMGVVAQAVLRLAPSTVVELAERAADVSVYVEMASPETLVRRLASNDLDLAVTSLPRDVKLNAFEIITIGKEHYCLVASNGHPLVSMGTVDLATALEQRWVLPPRASDFREQFEVAIAVAQFVRPRNVVETNSLAAMLAIVAQGTHVSLIPAEVARNWVARGQVVVVPTSFTMPELDIVLIARKGRPLSPAAQVVADIVRRQARAIWPHIAQPDLDAAPPAPARGTRERSVKRHSVFTPDSRGPRI